MSRGQIDHTRAEFNHYKEMMDRVLGSDESLRNQGKRRGGELVQLDDDNDPSINPAMGTVSDAGNTAAA